MNKYFLLDKRTNRVRMYMDKAPRVGDFDETIFEAVKADLTVQQEEDLKFGKKKAVIKNKKLNLLNY